MLGGCNAFHSGVHIEDLWDGRPPRPHRVQSYDTSNLRGVPFHYQTGRGFVYDRHIGQTLEDFPSAYHAYCGPIPSFAGLVLIAIQSLRLNDHDKFVYRRGNYGRYSRGPQKLNRYDSF